MASKVLDMVLDHTATLIAARRQIALLKEFLESVYFGEGGGEAPNIKSFDTFFADRPDDAVHVANMRAWVEKIFSYVNGPSLYALFEEIDTDLKKVAILTLYTPVPLPSEEYVKMCQMVRELTGTRVLIDDKVDLELPAGGAFVWKGVYHDHSLRSRFTREFDGFKQLVQSL